MAKIHFLLHHHQEGIPITSLTPWVPPLLAACARVSICLSATDSSALPGLERRAMSLSPSIIK